jgi:hypothetical protein
MIGTAFETLMEYVSSVLDRRLRGRSWCVGLKIRPACYCLPSIEYLL